MIVKFAKVDPRAKLPEYKTKGSVGCDICSLEDVVLKSQQLTKVRTGLVAIIPNCYNCYWELFPRSSLGIKHPGVVLANSVGIIDHDFCGPTDEICVLLLNTSSHDTFIKSGDRIAQLVLKECLTPDIEEITLEEVERFNTPRGGFGSTGVS